MKLRIDGHKFNYLLTYWYDERDIEVRLPRYMLGEDVRIKVNDKWVKCRFRYRHRKDKTKVDIRASAYKFDNKENKWVSELGDVNEDGYFKTLKLNKFNRFLIKTYDTVYLMKIRALKAFDWVKSIKKNFMLICISAIVAISYYFINLYNDNVLQKLINESIFVQSLIVFLSISSLINIFHPFTLRKEVSMKEVDKYVKRKQKEAKEAAKREERQKRKSV